MIGVRVDGRWVVALLALLGVLGAAWVLWLPATPDVPYAPAATPAGGEVEPGVSAKEVPTASRPAASGEVSSEEPPAAVPPTAVPTSEPHICSIPRGYHGGNTTLVTRVKGGKLDLPVAVPLESRDGYLVFSPRGEARKGVVQAEGEAVHTLSWTGEGRDTTCTLGPAPQPWSLSVRVVDPRDGAPLELLGCGLPGRYDGGVVTVERPPGSTCVVRARRRDGALVAESEAVELAPRDGEHVDLVLHVPDADVGGIGVGVRSVADGALVTDVPAGSPAARAGLLPGDVVVTAGGVPLGGLGLADQIAQVTGPVGEPVQLVVLRGGQVLDVEVERAWLDEEQP